MANETKKQKTKPEELNDEQLDQVAGGRLRRQLDSTTTKLSSDEELTTESVKRVRRKQ
jgi:hypothetical protein